MGTRERMSTPYDYGCSFEQRAAKLKLNGGLAVRLARRPVVAGFFSMGAGVCAHGGTVLR
jgi:hypothetical protein